MRILLTLLWLPSLCFANIGPQGFHEFAYNRVFIETGTYGGDGIRKALRAGFKEAYSVEIDPHLYNENMRQFSKKKNIHLFLGDSAKTLSTILKQIKEPATFWLDAHVFPPIQGIQNCPLIDELEQIRQHSIKTHTILIDDLHCCGTDAFDGLVEEDLIAKLLEINPEYQFKHVPGGDQGEYPENVLVAFPPKKGKAK